MRLLLDTCTFLWLAAEETRLSARAREAVEDGDNDLYLSAISAWEVAAKHALGRLELDDAPTRYVPEHRTRHGILALPFDEGAALCLGRLPRLHRDPFDRMLVCQAIMGGLTILTPDEDIRRYAVPTLW